jgi:hypothetical protein
MAWHEKPEPPPACCREELEYWEGPKNYFQSAITLCSLPVDYIELQGTGIRTNGENTPAVAPPATSSTWGRPQSDTNARPKAIRVLQEFLGGTNDVNLEKSSNGGAENQIG